MQMTAHTSSYILLQLLNAIKVLKSRADVITSEITSIYPVKDDVNVKFIAQLAADNDIINDLTKQQALPNAVDQELSCRGKAVVGSRATSKQIFKCFFYLIQMYLGSFYFHGKATIGWIIEKISSLNQRFDNSGG